MWFSVGAHTEYDNIVERGRYWKGLDSLPCHSQGGDGYSGVMMPSKSGGHSHPWGDAETPYAEMGGEQGVRELTEAFYDVIEEKSPLLRDMLPTSTRNTRRKFFMYLSGWLGGPPLYEQTWGHPRLRMRHMPFPIGDSEAKEWMRCMRAAMSRIGITEPLRSFLEERFEPLAQHMRNR